MRRAAVAALGVGVALVASSPILFLALGEGLILCPAQGVCHEEVIWTSYIPGIVSLVLGVVAIMAAGLLDRGRSPRVESS